MSKHYRPPPVSRASATTLCQKCLKRGHYSYECKGTSQDRPYVARPSRTQQLLNPKLAPKLNSDLPNDLVKRDGLADAQLAANAAARSRDAEMQEGPSRRERSSSFDSLDSVSTISTSRSHSASPARKHSATKPKPSPVRDSRKRRRPTRSRSRSRSRSVSSSGGEAEANRITRRRMSSFSPRERGRARTRDREARKKTYSRSRSMTDVRSRSRSGSNARPGARRQDGRGASPYHNGRSGTARRSRSPSQQSGPRRQEQRGPGVNGHVAERRQRSLSPYSKRLALTQGMQTGR